RPHAMRQHVEGGRSTCLYAFVRRRKRHADTLQGAAEAQGLAFAIAKRSTMRKTRIALARRRHYHARHVATRHRVQTDVAEQAEPKRRANRAPERSDAHGR